MPQETVIGDTSEMINHGLENQTPVNLASVKDAPYQLPSVFLTNVQSFGKSKTTDKTTESEEVLKLNCIDVAVFTETWETVDTLGNLDFSNYNMFHHIRKDCKRSSGGLSIFVKDHIPATKLSVVVPNNLEVLYVSIRPHKLPRSISNIILCGVYYPGSKSDYAPPQETLILHLPRLSIIFTINMHVP